MTILDLPLATPTGVLVYEGPALTDEWFETRRSGITATDLPEILGRGRYGNARSVWLDKLGQLPPDEDNKPAKYGRLLEPVVADDWAAEHGTTVRPVGILAHAQYRTHLASLDRLVDVCPDGDGPCALEVKCRSAYQSGDWRDEVPDEVYFQVQWQLHVSGYRHAHLAVLLGGNDPRWLRVDRDDPDIDVLVEAADDLWAKVLSGEPPQAVPNELMLRILNRRYPDREGQAVISLEAAEMLRAELQEAKAEKAEAEKAVRAAKDRITAATVAMVDLLGDAEAAFVPGSDVPAFAYVEKHRRGYTVAPTSWRQIEMPSGYHVPAPGEERA